MLVRMRTVAFCTCTAFSRAWKMGNCSLVALMMLQPWQPVNGVQPLHEENPVAAHVSWREQQHDVHVCRHTIRTGGADLDGTTHGDAADEVSESSDAVVGGEEGRDSDRVVRVHWVKPRRVRCRLRTHSRAHVKSPSLPEQSPQWPHNSRHRLSHTYLVVIAGVACIVIGGVKCNPHHGQIRARCACERSANTRHDKAAQEHARQHDGR